MVLIDMSQHPHETVREGYDCLCGLEWGEFIFIRVDCQLKHGLDEARRWLLMWRNIHFDIGYKEIEMILDYVAACQHARKVISRLRG